MTRFQRKIATKMRQENPWGAESGREIWPVNGVTFFLRSTFTDSIWNAFHSDKTFWLWAKPSLSWHKPFLQHSTISLFGRQTQVPTVKYVMLLHITSCCFCGARAKRFYFLGPNKTYSRFRTHFAEYWSHWRSLPFSDHWSTAKSILFDCIQFWTISLDFGQLSSIVFNFARIWSIPIDFFHYLVESIIRSISVDLCLFCSVSMDYVDFVPYWSNWVELESILVTFIP